MKPPRALPDGVLGALAVLVATYALLSIPALPRLARRALGQAPSDRLRWAFDKLLGRPGIALLGGAAMLAVGAVSPQVGLTAIDGGTLALLFGMMTLVAGLEVAGFFDFLASALARHLPTPRALLVGTMAVTALLSALVLNDAVVLLFTPVLVKATREMGLAATPFLSAEAVSANIGSVATPVGNPQNAYIALQSGLSFPAFAAALLPTALASLAIAIVLALWTFRKDLATPPAARPAPTGRITNRAMLALAGAVVALVFVGFLTGHRLALGLWQIALAGGVALLILAPLAGVSPVRVLAKVDWSILVLFAGLFLLLAGVRDAGILEGLYDLLSFAQLENVAGLALVSAVLSNVVSNVPAVLLLSPAVGALGSDDLWLALAAASTLAGNATLLGAAANVIVAETGRTFGADLDVWKFVRFGFPTTVLSLLVAVLLLR